MKVCIPLTDNREPVRTFNSTECTIPIEEESQSKLKLPRFMSLGEVVETSTCPQSCWKWMAKKLFQCYDAMPLGVFTYMPALQNL